MGRMGMYSRNQGQKSNEDKLWLRKGLRENGENIPQEYGGWGIRQWHDRSAQEWAAGDQMGAPGAGGPGARRVPCC